MATHLTRRQLLQAGGVGAAAGLLGGTGVAGAAAPAGCADLSKIEHIIIFIQENRSFDSYFGSYKGVRGFDDRSAPRGAAAFQQAFQDPNAGLPDPMLPFHLSTAVTVPPRQGECTNDVEHQWAGAHDSWHHGANDNWMSSHLATEPDPRQAAITMGYYDRSDLAFYYALADNFTICDNYYCSVLGGTDQNRLYSMTGTVDPDGWDGGGTFVDTKIGTVQDPGANLGVAGRWVPYPQVLSRAGISWRVYGTPDSQLGDNTLRYFPQYRPVGGNSALSMAAFGSNTFPADFAADCASGRLPQVSWLLSDLADTEHAPAPPEWGESIVHTVLAALTTSGAWQRSVLFVTYDENGGFFDHVPPPTAPRGTAGEYYDQRAITAACRKEMTTVRGVDTSAQPIGLGMRVPLLVVSPFTRNPSPGGPPLVCSDLNDHTSLLRFVESWSYAIGRPAPIPARDPTHRRPGLSPWRRGVVGDLSGALSLAAPPDASVPTAVLEVVPNRVSPSVVTECVITGTVGSESAQTEPIVQDPTVPTHIPFPSQETLRGRVRRPAASSCPAPVRAPGSPPAPAAASSPPASASGAGALPTTGALPSPPLLVTATGLVTAGLLALRRRTRA